MEPRGPWAASPSHPPAGWDQTLNSLIFLMCPGAHLARASRSSLTRRARPARQARTAQAQPHAAPAAANDPPRHVPRGSSASMGLYGRITSPVMRHLWDTTATGMGRPAPLHQVSRSFALAVSHPHTGASVHRDHVPPVLHARGLGVERRASTEATPTRPALSVQALARVIRDGLCP